LRWEAIFLAVRRHVSVFGPKNLITVSREWVSLCFNALNIEWAEYGLVTTQVNGYGRKKYGLSDFFNLFGLNSSKLASIDDEFRQTDTSQLAAGIFI
jgi:hypothetical protein